jgi:hypothetical protein
MSKDLDILSDILMGKNSQVQSLIVVNNWDRSKAAFA